MLNSLGKPSSLPKKQQKQEREWLASSFRPENFIPGLVIGFIVGLLWDLSKPAINDTRKKKNFVPGKLQEGSWVSSNGGEELKMVLVVRQDLKMKSGKIASQCAHAATGMYAELMYSHRSLLRQWEQNGQPKIVVLCKNQQEMNKLKEAAEDIGLPTFVVADAGRTQVLAGSKTVLAIGPGLFLSWVVYSLCFPFTLRYLLLGSPLASVLIPGAQGHCLRNWVSVCRDKRY